ncbi:hypothetical protein K431DRAFT_121600 [Polychaeton citri CBS 116435]|uniref:Uncharacterized protein n=1 Tax=Polychaeton citri CBS 116435 TaxID=1314669 RepID=A0A9P4Q6C7_9PEZI|nr:hypothetical protein K431DRAFT_121600 [Polychaeton citri CBS 116435]
MFVCIGNWLIDLARSSAPSMYKVQETVELSRARSVFIFTSIPNRGPLLATFYLSHFVCVVAVTIHLSRCQYVDLLMLMITQLLAARLSCWKASMFNGRCLQLTLLLQLFATPVYQHGHYRLFRATAQQETVS